MHNLLSGQTRKLGNFGILERGGGGGGVRGKFETGPKGGCICSDVKLRQSRYLP